MTANQTGHRIRLRGPWKYRWLDDPGHPLSDWESLRHPDDWPILVANRAGRLELTRNFHAPSNLDPDEALFVVLTGVHGDGEVRLNGQRLGGFDLEREAGEFACPLPLPFSNQLAISVSFTQPTESAPLVGLYGTVELMIRTEAKGSAITS